MTWTSKTSKIAPPPYDVRFNGGNTCLTDATGRIFAYCPEPETASLLAAAKRYRANLETPTNEERQVAEYHASAEGAAVAARVAVESIRALVEKAAAEYAPGGEDADPAHDEATEAARRGVA